MTGLVQDCAGESGRYAQSENGAHVAYQLFDADVQSGVGNDIVMVSGGLIPMEVFEDDPGFARLLEGLRSLGRVVVFDRRGVGVSDPIVDWERPVLDQWADDVSAVVDASGVRDAVIFAWDGYGISTRFAAKHPDRLRLLVLHHPLMVPNDRWDDWVANRRRPDPSERRRCRRQLLAADRSVPRSGCLVSRLVRPGRSRWRKPHDHDTHLGIGVQLTAE